MSLALSLALLRGCSVSWENATPAATVLGGSADDLDPASLALAAERTLEALKSQPRRRFHLAGRDFATRDLVSSARRVAAIARGSRDAEELTRRLATRCRALPAAEPAKVTAYFEPLLEARRR